MIFYVLYFFYYILYVCTVCTSGYWSCLEPGNFPKDIALKLGMSHWHDDMCYTLAWGQRPGPSETGLGPPEHSFSTRQIPSPLPHGSTVVWSLCAEDWHGMNSGRNHDTYWCLLSGECTIVMGSIVSLWMIPAPISTEPLTNPIFGRGPLAMPFLIVS